VRRVSETIFLFDVKQLKFINRTGATENQQKKTHTHTKKINSRNQKETKTNGKQMNLRA
jgi:hypothetical protein